MKFIKVTGYPVIQTSKGNLKMVPGLLIEISSRPYSEYSWLLEEGYAEQVLDNEAEKERLKKEIDQLICQAIELGLKKGIEGVPLLTFQKQTHEEIKQDNLIRASLGVEKFRLEMNDHNAKQ